MYIVDLVKYFLHQMERKKRYEAILLERKRRNRKRWVRKFDKLGEEIKKEKEYIWDSKEDVGINDLWTVERSKKVFDLLKEDVWTVDRRF